MNNIEIYKVFKLHKRFLTCGSVLGWASPVELWEPPLCAAPTPTCPKYWSDTRDLLIRSKPIARDMPHVLAIGAGADVVGIVLDRLPPCWVLGRAFEIGLKFGSMIATSLPDVHPRRALRSSRFEATINVRGMSPRGCSAPRISLPKLYFGAAPSVCPASLPAFVVTNSAPLGGESGSCARLDSANSGASRPDARQG